MSYNLGNTEENDMFDGELGKLGPKLNFKKRFQWIF